jgi:hypothetical protein
MKQETDFEIIEHQDMIDEVLQLERSKPADFWRDEAKIPIGSKRKYYDYENSEELTNDVVTIDIDTRGAQERNPFNCLICASTGVGKTRLIKNIVKGYHKQGYKILYIEPKGFEMYNSRWVGQGRRLHPLDLNEKLPVVSYVPNYIKAYLEKNLPDMVSKVNFYSPNIAKLDYREIWQSFGIPDKASDIIVERIVKNTNSIEKFMERIRKHPNIHSQTLNAALTSLNNLVGIGFFGTTKKLNLKKEWDKNNVVVVNYFSRDGIFMNTDVGLVLDSVRDIGINESRLGLNNVSKKLIIFDDAFYYAGMSATLANQGGGKYNLATRNISNCQNNFRTWGVDTMFVVQSPDPSSISQNLIDGCTTKLISYTENPSILRGKMPLDAFDFMSNTDPNRPRLFVDEDTYDFQWIYVRGRTKWKKFFPFDVSVGHV